MSDKAAARAAIWLGAATIAVLIGFNILERLIAGGCSRPAALFQFQLGGFDAARDVLMGLCGLERSRSLHWVNLIDVAVFIPLYAAFLIFSTRVLSGRWVGPLTSVAIAMVAGAALADWRETLAQLSVTAWTKTHHGGDFETQRAQMEVVLQAARAKYAFFAAHAAVLALIAFVKKPRPLRFIGGLTLLPIMGASAVADDPERAPLVAITFGAAWLTLIFYALRVARAKDAPLGSQTPQADPPR